MRAKRGVIVRAIAMISFSMPEPSTAITSRPVIRSGKESKTSTSRISSALILPPK